RSYDENIFYNLFSKEDIMDLKNVIRFAEGIVIKDNRLSSQYETNASLFAANSYMNAVENHKGIYGTNLTELERTSIINGYKESNPYYIYLKTKFGVSPLEARRARDFHIIKATNNT